MALILIGALALRGPLLVKLFQFQGKTVPAIDGMMTLSNQNVSSLSNKVIIFWASWCGPCKVELARINEYLAQGKLSPDQILTISIDSNKDELLKAIKDSNYSFPVVWDGDGSVSESFKVEVTPTIFVTNDQEQVLWATSGLSPFLYWRIKYYLN